MTKRKAKPPLGVTLHDLADLEVRLLDRVCRDGPYTSPVMLAADEWRGSEDWLVASVEMVMWTLYGLNEQGLVILREVVDNGRGTLTWGIPINYIRATPEAFDLLDYPRPIRVAGERANPMTDSPTKRFDTTEFRNHGEQAIGSPISRWSNLAEHLADFPQHLSSKCGW